MIFNLSNAQIARILRVIRKYEGMEDIIEQLELMLND